MAGSVMELPAGARKAALVTHVVTSVGWLGAVAAFLILAVTAVRTGDLATQRALYITMDVMGYTALVPLSLASFTSGLVQSLGTPWGLLRHWWVIVKLAISVIAPAVLLLSTSALIKSRRATKLRVAPLHRALWQLIVVGRRVPDEEPPTLAGDKASARQSLDDRNRAIVDVAVAFRGETDDVAKDRTALLPM